VTCSKVSKKYKKNPHIFLGVEKPTWLPKNAKLKADLRSARKKCKKMHAKKL